MWRALLPYLLLAEVIVVAATLTYLGGAPAWVLYGGVALAAIAVLPGYERWESRRPR